MTNFIRTFYQKIFFLYLLVKWWLGMCLFPWDGDGDGTPVEFHPMQGVPGSGRAVPSESVRSGSGRASVGRAVAGRAVAGRVCERCQKKLLEHPKVFVPPRKLFVGPKVFFQQDEWQKLFSERKALLQRAVYALLETSVLGLMSGDWLIFCNPFWFFSGLCGRPVSTAYLLPSMCLDSD